MKKSIVILATVIVSVLTFVSCSKEEGTSDEGKGHINVHLTDAPFPVSMVSSTVVTVDKVEIRQKNVSDVGNDEGTFIVIAEGEMKFDLLKLTNGLTEKIASADLDAGEYDMIRLHVTDASVTLKSGTTFNMDIPSGSESGLKISLDPAIRLDEGETTDVLLDFDLGRSFVMTGNIKVINGFKFKPVIRGVVLENAGRIEGTVTNTSEAPLANAVLKLWSQENASTWDTDKMVVSSFSDLNGSFKLIGLPIGKYSIICEMEGYQNDTLQNIEVTAQHSTTVNLKLNTVIE